MRSIHAVPAFCAALALAASCLTSQAPDPDLPLARATATAILQEMLQEPEVRFLVAPPAGRFDTLTAAELLAQAPGRQDPESAYALYVGTHGATIRGDSAVVMVLLRQHARSTGLNWWAEVDEFRFVRDGDGWRFVQRQPLSHADGGDVRGALDRPVARHLEQVDRSLITRRRG